MKVIQNGYAHAETIPLPCLHDDDGVLQYSSEFADRLIAESYGDDADKYEVNPRTLELFYRISDKMKFKVAEVTYESYFTDIKGTNADAAFREAWLEDLDATEPDDYELYSITIFHWNHRSLKSNLIDKPINKLKGLKSSKYIKGIIENIEDRLRGE